MLKQLFSGRIGRAGLIVGLVYYSLITLTVLFISATLLVAILTAHNRKLTQSQLVHPVEVLVIIWLAVIVLCQLSICARRLHDVDRPALLALLGIVPFANIPFVLYLLIAPGSLDENSYGQPLNSYRFRDVVLPGASNQKMIK